MENETDVIYIHPQKRIGFESISWTHFSRDG